jgi:hypothetical protein
MHPGRGEESGSRELAQGVAQWLTLRGFKDAALARQMRLEIPQPYTPLRPQRNGSPQVM